MTSDVGPDSQRTTLPPPFSNAEFIQAINEPTPNLVLVREMIIDAYAAQAGVTNPDLRDVARWFSDVCELRNSRCRGTICVEHTVVRYIMSSNITIKMQHLMQRKCQQCVIYEKVPFIFFFLRISPSSHQSNTTEMRRAFRLAIQEDLERKGFDFSDFYNSRLCVALTFVMANGKTKNDVDNLAKNLLDALQGFAYRNDQQIDHLDLLRVNSGTEETFVAIRMAVTDIGEMVDVINPEFPLAWIGSGPVDLARFLPT
jgi:Holliday junction resolvase RusA-like endonuclease